MRANHGEGSARGRKFGKLRRAGLEIAKVQRLGFQCKYGLRQDACYNLEASHERGLKAGERFVRERTSSARGVQLFRDTKRVDQTHLRGWRGDEGATSGVNFWPCSPWP
eukprot:12995732-Alexandrium_andersonii.AAC.1